MYGGLSAVGRRFGALASAALLVAFGSGASVAGSPLRCAVHVWSPGLLGTLFPFSQDFHGGLLAVTTQAYAALEPQHRPQQVPSGYG